MRIFTLGTDHRKHYEFSRLLFKYGIQTIFDVRRVPESQEDYFRRDGLQQLAASQAMDYVYLGNELGGPTRGDYREWTSSDEFKRGLDMIGRKAGKRVCCILCAERSPEHCHRRVIADHLAKSGIELVHILAEGEFWQPPPPGRPNLPDGRPRGTGNRGRRF